MRRKKKRKKKYVSYLVVDVCKYDRIVRNFEFKLRGPRANQNGLILEPNGFNRETENVQVLGFNRSELFEFCYNGIPSIDDELGSNGKMYKTKTAQT